MKLKLRGTELSLSYTLLCLAAVSVILGIFENMLYGVFAIVIHEAGHLIMMYKFGCFPKNIRVSLFEIAISDPGRQQRSRKENFFIIFFGPFANFICVILGFLLYLLGVGDIQRFLYANLSVGLLNSLPVMSLDGGQLLYLFLSKRFSPRTSERVVDIITVILLIPLSAAGFLLLFVSKNNISLLFVSAYLLISLLTRRGRIY